MTIRSRSRIAYRLLAILALAAVAGLLIKASLTHVASAQPPAADDQQDHKVEDPLRVPAKRPISFGPDPSRHLTVIQTDKPIYRPGESVYVRGVMLHHAKRTLLPTTPNTKLGMLEVKSPKGEVIATMALQGQDGVWGVKWLAPAEIAGGEYTLKVSYPQLGLPPAEQTFDIRSYRAPRLKSQIKFIRDGYGPGDEVAATLEVERAEGGIPVGAPVSVTARVDGKQVHAGKAKVGADGFCQVTFSLPEKIERGEGVLALAIQDGGVETATKTIPILLQTVDMTFYPEGGDLVADLPNRVYFEAFTPSGKPADLAGRIVDNRGKVAAKFRSEHDGRGRVAFTPQPNREYRAEITEPAGITRPVALPPVKAEGVTLISRQDVFDVDDPITLSLASTTQQRIKLILRKRDQEVAAKTVKVGAKSEQVSLNLGDAPHADGVLTATAYNAEGRPLAERLVFREPRHHVQIRITPEAGPGFVPGETVRVKIETTNELDEPVSALVGVTVSDESVLEMIDRREQAAALPVAMLLESEVQDLADAHVYFDPENEEAPFAVDLLLGVQGWRRFALVNPEHWLQQHSERGRTVLALGLPLPLTQTLTRGAFGMGMGGAGGFPGGPAGNFLKGAPQEPVDLAKEAPRPDDKKLALGVDPQEEFARKKLLKLAEKNDALFEREKPAKREPLRDAQEADAHRNQLGKALPAQGGDRQGREAKDFDFANNELGGFGGGFGGFGDEDGLGSGMPENRRWQLQQAQSQFFRFAQAPPVSFRVYRHDIRPNRKPGERIDFAETLYWTAGVKTNEQGVAHIDFDLSDAVTSYRIAADAVGGDGGLGAEAQAIESVEPFYLEPKLPLEVTMGDMIQTPLAVVNSTKTELRDVTVSLETEGLGAEARIKPFAVGAGQRLRKRVNIHVGDYVGTASLAIDAKAGDYIDRVTRSLQVAPLGFPHEDGAGALLPAGGVFASQIRIPADVVPGSVAATATAYPTPLATMTSAMERLIREPNGCFEQTSSTTYPLVMAQQYFKSHQGVDPSLIQRSATILQKGYDRLTGFECPGGGYEWFGNDPGHDALTAYGLLEFTDMSLVRPVDAEMLERTREWLLKQRDGKGGYLRKTRTLHTWRADPEVAFSYNTWALLEAGVPASQLQREVDWVADAAESSQNTYVIALGANVVQLAGKQDVANRLLDKLSGLQEDNGSVSGAVVSVVGSGGEALTIEASSLAMLAWMKHDSHASQVEKGIKYLAEVCKGGRFGSTQSTVLALRAIVEYDARRAQPTTVGAVTLWVDGEQVGTAMAFDKDTHGAIQLADFSESLTPGVHQVELRMEDGTEMPCTVSWSYNSLTPDSSEQCKLHLEVKLANRRVREGETTEMEAVVVNRSEDKVPSPTAIIGVPGGLEVRHDQLKELVEEGKIASYEVRGREVILYWRVLDGEQRVRVPLSLVAAVPGKYTAPASRAYLYYTDEHKVWQSGPTVEIRSR